MQSKNSFVNAEEKFGCGQCGETFINLATLKKHRTTCFPDHLPNIPSTSTECCQRHTAQRALNGTTQYIRFTPHNSNVQPTDFFSDNEVVINDAINQLTDGCLECKIHPVLEITIIQLNEYGEESRRETVIFSIEATPLKLESLSTIVALLLAKIDLFVQNGSGWIISGTNFFDLRVTRYHSVPSRRGYGHLSKLPKRLASKGAVINIISNDSKCFQHSLLAAIHSKEVTRSMRNQPRGYKRWVNKYNWNDIEFPMNARQLSRFERNNSSLTINLLEWNEKNEQNPLRILRAARRPEENEEVRRIVNILLLKDSAHYVPVISLNRLLGCKQRPDGTQPGRQYFCERCFQPFTSKERLEKHRKICYSHLEIAIEPSHFNTMEFRRFGLSQRLPYIVYADIECLLDNSSCDGRNLSKHIPAAFGMLLVSHPSLHDSPLEMEYIYFAGPDCIMRAMETLQSWAVAVYQWNRKHAHQLVKMTPEQHHEYQEASRCYLCNTEFCKSVIKVVEHDHLTAEYRGAACVECNGKLKLNRRYLPVFFHNFRGYDAHILCQAALGQMKGWTYNVIPQTKEKYLALMASFEVDKYQCKNKSTKRIEERPLYMKIEFKDSLQFLPSSLSALVKNLDEQELKLTKKAFPNRSQTSLITEKGVFPYSYFNSFIRLEETKIPPKCAFTNDLTQEECSEEDYARAKKSWHQFNCKNFGDYMLAYLKMDVHQLADVFEAFRELSLREDGLDPAYFYSAPGMSWQSAFKMTNAKVELIKDPEMFIFFERGIRGGMTFVNKHYQKANTPRIPNEHSTKSEFYTYREERPLRELLYVDANNLYGNALSMSLPHSDFKWMSAEEIKSIDFSNADLEADRGYIVEVDLHYPEWVQDRTRDLPFAPEKRTICDEMLTPFMKNQWEELCTSRNGANASTYKGTEKLLLTHYDKTNYICHARLLQFYLKQGLELTRIHRGVVFHQEAFFEPYVSYNSRRRQESTTSFEKDYYKLKLNSLFGKCMENMRNRMRFRLCNDPKTAVTLSSRGDFLSSTIFNPDLVGIHLCPETMLMSKPVYIGMAVLELSKLVMYTLRYNQLDRYAEMYGGDIQILAGDTDSFFLRLTGFDMSHLVPQMRKDGLLDTSNFPETHPDHSNEYKAKLGCIKDESGGAPQLEWIFLRPKAYSLLSANRKNHLRAKGVQRCLLKSGRIRHSQYLQAYRKQKEFYHNQRRLASSLHRITTLAYRKRTLSYFEDKRAWVRLNQSLPYGNYLLSRFFSDYSQKPPKQISLCAPQLVE